MKVCGLTVPFFSNSYTAQGFDNTCSSRVYALASAIFKRISAFFSWLFSCSNVSSSRSEASDAYWKGIVQPNWASTKEPGVGTFPSDQLLKACQRTGRTDCSYSKIFIKNTGGSPMNWFTIEQLGNYHYLGDRVSKGEFNDPSVLFIAVGDASLEEAVEAPQEFRRLYPSIEKADFYILPRKAFAYQINQKKPKLPHALAQILFKSRKTG